MQAKGMKSALRIGFEDEFGTAQTTADKIVKMPFNANSLKSSQSLIKSETITGTRNPVEPGNGQKECAGDITVPLDARSIGYWLKAMFGAPETAAVEGKEGFYKHTFKIKDEQPSLTIEKAFDDIKKYERFIGCKLSSMDFDAEVGNNETTVKMSFMGKDGGPSEESLNAKATYKPLIRFDNINCTVKTDGETLATARKLTTTINGGLDGDTFCLDGTASRTDIAEGIMAVSGTLTTLFTDLSMLNKAINGTNISIEQIMKRGDYELSILIPQAKLERSSPEISGPKGITLETNYEAFTDEGDANSVVVVKLTNDVAAY